MQPVSLAPRFDGELPPLAHDWVGEVRAHPDQLGVPLPGWSGPSPSVELPPSDPSEAAGGCAAASARAGGQLTAVPNVLEALLAGGGIVAPAGAVDQRRAADESVTGRA